MHAHVGAVFAGETAGDVLHEGLQLRVAQRKGALAQPHLLAVHHRPQPALVAARVGPREPRRDLPGGLRRGWIWREAANAASAAAGEKAAAVHFATGDSSSSAFTVSAALSASLRAPPARSRRLYHSTRPGSRSNSEA